MRTDNTHRALRALESIGCCLQVQRLADAIMLAEASVGREITRGELRKLAAEVHESVTGEKIGAIDLSDFRLGVSTFAPIGGAQ